MIPALSRLAISLVLLLGFPLSARAGGLDFIAVQFDNTAGVDGLDGASAVAVSPNGQNMYVASETDDAVAVFCLFCPTILGFVEMKKDGVGGVDGLNGARAVAVSPDARNVYVGGRSDDAVAVFSRDSATGALTFVEVQKEGIGGVDGLNGVISVVVSPDGAHVYAAGANDDAVAVFSRNATTGALGFVEVQRDGVGGVSGLHSPRTLAISDDGKSLYTVANLSDDIVLFARNGTTGALTFAGATQNGDGGTRGLRGASGAVVSHDGGHVYVSSIDDSAIVTFARNATTGALTFLDVQDHVVGVGGLGGRALAVSDDDRAVYLTDGAKDALLMFRRDPTSGRLTFNDAQRDGVGGVDGLHNVRAVAVRDPFVFAASNDFSPFTTSNNGALSLFIVDGCGSGIITGEEECEDNNLTSGDGCSAECRLETCTPVPATGCRQTTVTGKSSLVITDDTDDTRDVLAWRWDKGEATSSADLGDVSTFSGTTAYVLCVYDGSAAPQPLLSLAAPHGGACDGVACWTSHPTNLRYKDKVLTPDGVSAATVRAGSAGHARASLKARGSVLRLPTLPLTPPVRVQLRRSDAPAECWDASFSATILRNDATGFRANSD